MAGIFDDGNLRAVLERYLPQGETLTAGVHCVGLEVRLQERFCGAVVIDGTVAPLEGEDVPPILFTKSKDTWFDAYLGLSEHHLLFAPCEDESWHYQVEKLDDPADDLTHIDCPIPFDAIGTCFSLTEVTGFEQKKSIMGSINCRITLRDGSCLKLMLPKRGGVGGGMPHHAQYRDAIITRLNKAGGRS